MITLHPMTESEFIEYLERTIPNYAQDHVEAGNWSEAEALERSRQEFEHDLPQGIRTPGNYLFSLVNEKGEKAGILWYAALPRKPGSAFIYDFEIYPAYRRRGYASQALAELERDARGRGLKKLELHVFGHNTAARELYKKAGYIETNVNMSRQIEGG